MLELRTYRKSEIEPIFNCRSRQSLLRKLDRYSIEYDISGYGEYIVNIHKIEEYFKVYCILELGFDAHSDFRKLKEFYYYFLCCDEFQGFPDEQKEKYMNTQGTPVSRQTISRWIKKLELKNLIFRGENARYYFAYAGIVTESDAETYKEAWRSYFADKEMFDYTTAFDNMISKYGGVPRKHLLPEINALYCDKVNELIELVSKDIEKL